MRLSYLSLFILLGACASTGTNEAAKISAADAPPLATATPATSVPASPPVVNASVASASLSADTASSTQGMATASSSASDAAGAAATPVNPVPSLTYTTFEQWKQNFIIKARSRGFDEAFVNQMLDGVQPLATVTASDSQQPEFSRPISAYMRAAISPARAMAARDKLAANVNVPDIEKQYGVPANVLGGIWTMESDLGRVQGNIDVVAALSTLAYNGRRRVWAEDQLIAVLTILQQGKIARGALKGSWAGAMGQTQFEPDNYLKLGVDGDHDGKVDIWSSDSDALASTANLLSQAGWKPGEEWAVEVILPGGFDDYLSETAKMKPAAWLAMGVKRADGAAFTAAEADEDATLILPSGAQGPAFLALPNHYVIRKYNNSTAYALAVGLIADGIADKPALVTPWPVEQPLSLDQRMKSQQALKAAGFDPGANDGVIGVQTRQAIRDWQRANHLTADGYLSYDLASRFVAMVAAAPPAMATPVPAPVPTTPPPATP